MTLKMTISQILALAEAINHAAREEAEINRRRKVANPDGFIPAEVLPQFRYAMSRTAKYLQPSIDVYNEQVKPFVEDRDKTLADLAEKDADGKPIIDGRSYSFPEGVDVEKVIGELVEKHKLVDLLNTVEEVQIHAVGLAHYPAVLSHMYDRLKLLVIEEHETP